MSSCLLSSLRFLATKTLISRHHPNLFLSPKSTNLSLYRSITSQPISAAKPSSPPPPSSSSSITQPISELPPKLQEIITLFQSVPEDKAKYEQLLFYAQKLKPLEDRFKTRENKVDGCVSLVYIRAYLDEEKRVFYEAWSDSVLTKGLAALLVNGLSGRPAVEVLRVSPDFATLLGLQQSLTPSRSNGFLNMFKLMKVKTAELVKEMETSGGKVKSLRESSNLDGSSEEGSGGNSNSVSKSELNLNPQMAGSQHLVTGSSLNLEGNSEEGSEGNSNSGSGSRSGRLGGRGMRIKEKLERELRPVELEVDDVSYQHAGHAGVRGSDGETHFNLKIVSKEFEGKSLVKRHRLVYVLLQDELDSGLHALSIVAKTPSEVGAK